MARIHGITLSILPILGLLILATSADVPPPRIVHIDVTYNNEIIDSVFYAQILGCLSELTEENVREYLENVVERHAIEQLAFEEFDRDGNCYWVPIGWCSCECTHSKCEIECNYDREFKLAVYIPKLDKVFVSGEMEAENITVAENRDSFYEANLLPDGTIDMKRTVGVAGKAGIREYKVKIVKRALSVTLLIELLIALIYINVGRTAIPKCSKKQVRVLLTIFLANIVSLPILWFIFLSIWNSFFMVILGEIFVIFFEGFLIYLLNKPVLPIKDALLLSFILNVGSVVLGYPLYFLLLYGV
ncbi:MAG: hypothetical protein AYK19_01865 [Theionarchaea archaeon DG-70-1]|nr:MAG: hypothetical protein AYK19_01865 [Theionarchaea archaeon DG-70-1]